MPCTHSGLNNTVHVEECVVYTVSHFDTQLIHVDIFDFWTPPKSTTDLPFLVSIQYILGHFFPVDLLLMLSVKQVGMGVYLFGAN